MSHTPTPYITVTSNEKCPLPTGIPIAIHRKDEPWKKEGAICEMVAQGRDGKYSRELTEATAAFIVEACNAYERLKKERGAGLDICNRLMGYFKYGTCVTPSTRWCDRITAKEMVERVIALCERGAE